MKTIKDFAKTIPPKNVETALGTLKTSHYDAMPISDITNISGKNKNIWIKVEPDYDGCYYADDMPGIKLSIYKVRKEAKKEKLIRAAEILKKHKQICKKDNCEWCKIR